MNLLDLIFPKICVGCGQEGQYICDNCQKKLVKPEAICPMCCKPSLDGWTHPRCKIPSGMERLLVGLPYRGMVQNCLKKVKYKSAWDVIEFLFRLQTIDLGFQDFVITSVPMWREKEQNRGFNQAKMLAQLIGNNVELLERTRGTKPMFGLTKIQRKENINGAFKINTKIIKEPKNQKIILVDDVWTTGATMRECAKVLKLNGVEEVWGIALAR